MSVHPFEVPTSVTSAVYGLPGGHPASGWSQNELAEFLAPLWDTVEKHFAAEQAKAAAEQLAKAALAVQELDMTQRSGSEHYCSGYRDGVSDAHSTIEQLAQQ